MASIVRSPNIPEYESRVLQFSAQYSETPKHLECSEYAKSTWLRASRAEEFKPGLINTLTLESQSPHA
jgi:hypothetical protein